MGQNISNQPKLSGEITLNRIRATCQRDDKMPAELKNFNISLLANDLNALGMDIPIVDLHGRKRSSDDICHDIKRATHPDVESVCMVSNRRDAVVAVENMVNTFNKNYGARIQLYRDPLNKSRGKRNLAEICDDLYLVLDKVHRKLTDQPRVIKQKLEDMILMLEDRKHAIESRMGPIISNIAHARDHDKTNEKIKTADTLYKATNSLLNAQLRGAHALAANTIQNLDGDSFNALGQGGIASSLNMMKTNLAGYEGKRFDSNRNVTDTVQKLLMAATASGMALNDCQKCIRKFNVEVGVLPPESAARHALLQPQLARLVKTSSSDVEVKELLDCYTTLTKEAGCSVMDNTTAAGVFTGFETSPMFTSGQNANQIGNIMDLIGAAVVKRQDPRQRQVFTATHGNASPFAAAPAAAPVAGPNIPPPPPRRSAPAGTAGTAAGTTGRKSAGAALGTGASASKTTAPAGTI